MSFVVTSGCWPDSHYFSLAGLGYGCHQLAMHFDRFINFQFVYKQEGLSPLWHVLIYGGLFFFGISSDSMQTLLENEFPTEKISLNKHNLALNYL